MWLIPFRRQVLDTPYAPEAVLAHLGERLDPPSTSAWPWRAPRRPLRGVIADHKFAVSPNVSAISCRSGLLILGEVERSKDGSRIRATVRYDWFQTAFYGLFGAFAVAMLGVLVALVLKGDPLGGGTLPACLMPASLYLLIAGVLEWSISRSMKDLHAALRP